MVSYTDLQVIKQIGSGSFASVYLAHDANHIPYAIKSVQKHIKSRDSLRTMKREQAILLSIPSHPNIVKLHDTVETQNNIHLIMEACHQDLYDYLMERFPQGMPLVDAISVFIKLLQAVIHCHANQVYHRDIKPENVLIALSQDKSLAPQDIQIKLADFGLATRDKLSNEYGCGSIRYMSPESCHDNTGNAAVAPFHSSEKADIWALGIVLINLMTGRNPWEKPTRGDSHYVRFLNNRSKAFFHRIFGLPQSIDSILESIFQETPETRPSAMTLLHQFEQLQSTLLQKASVISPSILSHQNRTDKMTSHRRPQQTIMVYS